MSFVRETSINAIRKARRCDGCGVVIALGESAIAWAGMTDGDFGTATYHPDCRAAEIGLNGLMDLNSNEWWPLREIDHDDRRWLAASFPAVAARMNIVVTT